MIYEGKEYVEVTDGSCSVGDLMHITELGVKKHVGLCFTMDATINPYVDRILADESNVLDPLCDKFTRYREVVEQIIPLTNPKKAQDLINQTSKITNQTDTVNSPSHYNQTKIEAIDIIEDVTAGYQSNVKYHIGNAIKYLIRAPFKNNTVEDLKKAVWYINRAVGKLEGEQNKH